MGDIKPIERFRAAHRLIIDEDNLFGAVDVIPKVQRLIADVESALTISTGRDSQELRFLQARLTESAAWLYQDLGDHDAAREWLDVSLNQALAEDNKTLVAFVLGRAGQLAGDTGNARVAIASGESAAAHAPNPGLAAVAQTFAGVGYALAGDYQSAERAYGEARHLAQTVDPESPGSGWIGDPYILAHRARSLSDLGRFSESITTYRAALGELDGARFHRDRGVYLAGLSRAHAGDHDTEAAARVAGDALAIARDTRSGRIVNELFKVDQALATQSAEPALQFRDAFRSALSSPN